MIFDPETGRLDNVSFHSAKTRRKTGLRENHTATALEDGRVLIAGGSVQGNISDALFITADLEEQPAGTMVEARSLHTATLLDDGRVLVVGGQGDEPLASAETCLTRPPGPSWKAAEALPGPRLDHTATRLQDGKVLVIGGRASQEEGAAVEETVMVFDPETGAWQEAGQLVTARYNHTATLLDDGRVAVVGGRGADGKALSSIEIYWPLARGFCIAAPMDTARSEHTVTLLESGTLLVLGGSNEENEAMDSGVLFQPGR
jgi:hypothetical protein